jgi:uncharacterized membrane protein YdbT with pleckstrin-like domain
MAKDSELLPGERRLLAVNRHPVVLAGRCALVLLLGLVVVTVVALLPLQGGLRDLRWFVILFVVLVMFVFVDIQFIRWRAESYTITDQRIIIRRGVISHFSRAIGLSRVQDVSTFQALLGRMFGFGTVEIETAGRDGAEVLTYVPRPMEFRNVIYENLQEGGPGQEARRSPA